MSSNQPPPHGQDPYGAGEEPTRHAAPRNTPSGQPPQQYGAQGSQQYGGPGGQYGGPAGPGGPYGGPGGGGYGPPPKKSRAGLFAIIGVVLLLIVGGVIAAVLFLGNDDDSDDSATDDESTSESSESASESPSETDDGTSAGSVSGDGYTYDVPADWSDVTSDVAAQEPSVDTAIAAGSSIQGSQANIIVESGPAGGETDPEEGRDSWKNNLQASTGATPEDIDNSEIGGEDAIGVRIERTNEGGVDIVQVGYLTIKDDKIYAVTISTTTDNEDKALDVFEEVSDSWEWL